MREAPTSLQPPRAEAPPTFRHVLLTRFNVRYVEDPHAPSIGVDPAWLGERFALFERYCLPSVMAQSSQNFAWLIFFDEQTPEPFRTRAMALATARPGIHPVFCGALPLELVKQRIRELVPGDYAWLLTTRLDNDDGLHADFAAAVQQAQRFERAEVLNFPVGVILQGRRAYRQRHPSNAFISLSEPAAEAQTIFGVRNHMLAAESYPVRQLGDGPMWLQVIHASNISNRVRGRRVRLGWAAAAFPAALGERAAADDSGLAIAWENLTLFWVRWLRDALVGVARRALRTVGLDLRRKPAPRRSLAPGAGGAP